VSRGPVDNDLILQLARLISGQTIPQEIPEAGWTKINHLAVRQGMGPLLWWKVRQSGMPIPVSADFKQLENSAKIAAFNFRLQRESQIIVQSALAKAGIPVIWLKGMALAQTLYPLPEIRPMDDIDLLVPYELGQMAVQEVQGIGYHFPPEHALAGKIPAPETMLYHYHLLGGPSGAVELEIHVRLLADEALLPQQEMNWFWHESEMAGEGQAAFTVLKSEANFLYLCAHTILHHGEFEFRLQRVYDLHLLVSQTRMDWDLVINQANKFGWNYTVARCLTLIQDYFSTPVPQSVLLACRGYEKVDKDFIRARRLQGDGHRWETRLLHLSGLPWRERMRQVFHLIFPPREYMRFRYAIPPDRASLPYYFYRWWDAAREIFLSALRRFRQ